MLEIIGAPYENIVMNENQYQVLSFCSLCSLIMNKKQNFQHVFGLLLEDNRYKNILGEMLSSDDDVETLRTFLACDSKGEVAKSKYVARVMKNQGIVA